MTEHEPVSFSAGDHVRLGLLCHCHDDFTGHYPGWRTDCEARPAGRYPRFSGTLSRTWTPWQIYETLARVGPEDEREAWLRQAEICQDARDEWARQGGCPTRRDDGAYRYPPTDRQRRRVSE